MRKFVLAFVLFALFPLSIAKADTFDERVERSLAWLSPAADRSLELSLVAMECAYIGGGELIGRSGVSQGQIAFATCPDDAEISLRTSVNLDGVGSSELRNPGKPEADGLSFSKRENRNGSAETFIYSWRNQEGVQYQLRYYNAGSEIAAQEYLRPMALQIKGEI